MPRKMRACVALKVRGDSMMNAHILDGDIVILDDRKEAQERRHRRSINRRRDNIETLRSPNTAVPYLRGGKPALSRSTPGP